MKSLNIREVILQKAYRDLDEVNVQFPSTKHLILKLP